GLEDRVDLWAEQDECGDNHHGHQRNDQGVFHQALTAKQSASRQTFAHALCPPLIGHLPTVFSAQVRETSNQARNVLRHPWTLEPAAMSDTRAPAIEVAASDRPDSDWEMCRRNL